MLEIKRRSNTLIQIQDIKSMQSAYSFLIGGYNMRKVDVFATYREYCKDMNKAYKTIKDYMNDTRAEEICKLRGYVHQEQYDLMNKLHIGQSFLPDISAIGDRAKDLGIYTEDDYYLMDGRYVVPIYDIESNLVAMVGWYPDYKKYITTSSMFFAKNMLYFNIDHAYRLSWAKFDGVVFLVEGIFDALSLRAIGLPAIATMGANVSSPKSELLKLFNKVIAVPDNDKTGKKAFARGTKDSWIVPRNTTFVKISGKCKTEFGDLKIKDMDNLISYYPIEDVRSTLLEIAKSDKYIEEIKL